MPQSDNLIWMRVAKLMYHTMHVGSRLLFYLVAPEGAILFFKLRKLSFVGRIQRYKRLSCRRDHQEKISASCAHRGNLEICFSVSCS